METVQHQIQQDDLHHERKIDTRKDQGLEEEGNPVEILI